MMCTLRFIQNKPAKYSLQINKVFQAGRGVHQLLLRGHEDFVLLVADALGVRELLLGRGDLRGELVDGARERQDRRLRVLDRGLGVEGVQEK